MSKLSNKNSGAIVFTDLKRPSVKIGYALIIIIMVLCSVICVFPPLWVMVSSLKDIKEFLSIPPTIIPHSFHPEKLVETWNMMNFTSSYLNTLWVAIGSVVCAIVFNGLMGYVLSRLKPAGTVLVFSLMLWTMMLPNTVGLVPLYKHIINVKMLNSFIPLWLMRGASAYYVIVFKSFFDSISKEYIEAARIDGCTDLMIFFRIVVPLSKPVIMVITLFTLNGVWSDFLWPYLTLTDKKLFTVMVKLYRMGTNYSIDKKMIAMTFAIIPAFRWAASRADPRDGRTKRDPEGIALSGSVCQKTISRRVKAAPRGSQPKRCGERFRALPQTFRQAALTAAALLFF